MEKFFDRIVSVLTGRPPTQLPPQYERKHQISNGAFSSVFCVKLRGKRNNILYAAKYLKAHTDAADREVQVLRRLQKSQHVLKFIECFRCEFHTIIITEYLSGGDLFERLSKPEYKLTEAKCQSFMRQILRGMEFIHDADIVHLDIKPFNILFSNKDKDFGLKIIDFGLAQRLEAGGSIKLKKMQGTLEFMSPEVMNCESASTMSDMWSVGVVAYMLVSGGVSPFYSGSRFRTMARSLSCEFDLTIPELDHTSPEAKALVGSLLVTDPNKRLTATQSLNHPWLNRDDIYVDVLHELETTWMRRCLARRRWYRALNALRAMHTMRKFSLPEPSPTSLEESDNNKPNNNNAVSLAEPTRIAVVEENIAEPKDFELYKHTYENICLIGSGTYGAVYFVREKESGDVAAAKYLRQEKSKVRAEAAVLKKLIQSAFVVQLVGLYESTLNSILVTEYLAGKDLVTRTASDEFCLTERKCQIFIRQVVRGVQFIHSQRIIHLDLKPFNIIFANANDDYNLRIIDFGLAEQLQGWEDQVKITMCGTLEYMSPEVMDCKFASFASDMWGLGVIAYLLTSGGISPFWAGNRYRTMAKVLDCDYDYDKPNFAHVSENAKDFISKLLLKDPKERLSATNCLSHPWLTDTRVYVELLHTLETAWMKGLLARRRWHRWFHAITAMHRMRKMSADNK